MTWLEGLLTLRVGAAVLLEWDRLGRALGDLAAWLRLAETGGDAEPVGWPITAAGDSTCAWAAEVPRVPSP